MVRAIIDHRYQKFVVWYEICDIVARVVLKLDLSDKGKPSERVGRKAFDLSAEKSAYGGRVTEIGRASDHIIRLPSTCN